MAKSITWKTYHKIHKTWCSKCTTFIVCKPSLGIRMSSRDWEFKYGWDKNKKEACFTAKSIWGKGKDRIML